MKHVAVIGAGIAGASAAYHLARAGAEVTIIDAGKKGQATQAAAGIVCPWTSQRRSRAWYRLAARGARYYPVLIDELNQLGERDTGYRRIGCLTLLAEKERADIFRERVEQRRKEAPEVGEIALLSPSEATAHFPFLSDRYYALHVSGGARVDGRKLSRALVRAAVKLGARCVEGQGRLLWSGNRVGGVEVNGQRLPADEVIVAAGAWAAELLRPLGIRFLVRWQKGEIVHLRMPEANSARDWPVVMSPKQPSIVPFEDGRIAVGATHQNISEYDAAMTAGGVYEMIRKGFALAPGLAAGGMVEARVGLRPFTPRFLPVMGRVPGWEGLMAMNGLGASGLTTGPFMGLEVARLTLGGENELNLADYAIANALAIGERAPDPFQRAETEVPEPDMAEHDLQRKRKQTND